MEVSQIAELDTHAIIGGGKAKAFRMSESAEFFTVLSDTLYRDKKRAVVREIICNGWDGHIVVGKTDTPLEVTLTETELRIRDFGPGIPHNKIGDIYCVYGASTKVKSADQTGGFGLGSKAPFAYSDHFTVMSHIDGEKRVYAISRGGAETEGVPDFREMVKVPTTETGICVSVPLKNANDFAVFQEIIRSVVRYSGMLVKLNGVLLDTVDYSKATNKFIVVPSSHDLSESRVYCRYGTVVYPVTTQDRDIQREANDFANLFGDNARIILLAPPNSVGVTPSREALSYTDRTTATIREAIAGATKIIRSEMKRWVKPVIADTAATIAKNAEAGRDKIWNREFNHVDFKTNMRISKMCVTLEEMSKFACAINIHSLIKDNTKLSRLALSKHAGPARSIFRRAAYGPFHSKRKYGQSFLLPMNRFRFDSRLVRRLACKLDITPYMFFGAINGHSYDMEIKRLQSMGTINIPSNITAVLREPNKIWISSNHRDAIKKINSLRAHHVNYSEMHLYSVIVLPKKLAGMVDQIKEAAKKLKIEVEEVAYTAPVKKQTKKEIIAEENDETLYYTLGDINKNGNIITTGPGAVSQKALAKDANFYMRVNSDFRYYVYPQIHQDQKDILKKLLGPVLLVDDSREEDKLKKAGLRDISLGIADELIKHKDNKAALYGLVYKSFISMTEYGKFSSLLSDLINSDIGFAYKFFPLAKKDQDAKISPLISELMSIIKTIKANSESKRAKESADQALKIVTDMKTAAKEMFKDYFLDKKKFQEKYGHLDIIAGVQYHLRYSETKEYEEQKEMLTEVCDFIDRKHKMKIKVRKKEEKEAEERAAKLPIPSSRALVIINQPITAKAEIVSETAETTKEAA